MKMKKVLCSILALAMVLSTMSFTAFANETTVSTADEFYNAVKNAVAGDVINLDADVTYDVWNSVWNKTDLTINGNGHTITVNAIDSGVNGGAMLRSATNLTIKNINVDLPSPATNEMERVATMNGGTFENVSVTGGSFALSILGSNEVIIKNCSFAGINEWAIETEGKSGDAALTITNSTFDENAVILRGANNEFTGNTITGSGEGVNVLGDAVITGNDFGESTLGIDRGVEVTIEKNIINNVEFSSWLSGDYSEVTVENNTLSDEAVAEMNDKLDAEVVSVDPVAEVNGKKYYTFAEAMANATDDDNDGIVTINIYGKVEIGAAYQIKVASEKVNFVGMTDDAEIYVTAKPSDNGIVYVANNAIEELNFSNLKLSRPNGEWRGNEGHHNRFFTVWDSDGSTDLITYTNCVFPNGAGNNQYGKTTYTGCTFNNDVYYALWIYGSGDKGVVEVTGCTFDADRGVKIYSEDASATVSTTITDSTFAIDSKPAIVSSIAGELVIEEVDATACEYGLLASEPKDGRTDLKSAVVTVDGESPAYVAKVGNLLCTDIDYAEEEASDDKPVEVAVAKVGGTYFFDLPSAFKAITEENNVVEILTNVTIAEDWDNRSNGAKTTVPVTINGNGNTLKFTGKINDGQNFHSVFRFEKDATVHELTIDLSEATSANATRMRAISAKANLTIDKCTFLGNTAYTNTRAIIFGEGAGAAVGDINVSVTNSAFTNWKKGLTDNENAQDVKSVTVTGNTFTDASVAISAFETITVTDNVVDGGYVQMTSYTEPNDLVVTATGNTLDEEYADYNVIKAGKTINAQEEFKTPAVSVGEYGFASVDKAIETVETDGELTIVGDTTLTEEQVTALRTKNATIVLNSGEITINSAMDYSDFISVPKGYTLETTETKDDEGNVAAIIYTLEEEVQKKPLGGLPGGGGFGLGTNKTDDAEKPTDTEEPANAEKPADTETTGFIDLDAEAWYYDVVNTAIAKGLMNGVSETEFAPDLNLTRGMFVTILYRADGKTAVEGESDFSDVAEGQYYTDAVIWAAANGIVTGMTEEVFAPDENVTREQMATMISRYLAYKEIEISKEGEIVYTDDAEIAYWAKDAVAEMKRAGLLEGDADGNFAPKRNATRAEAAALFVRLLNIL